MDYIFSSATPVLSEKQIHYLFFAERHGKSKCDSEIGEIKRHKDQDEFIGKTIHIPNIKSYLYIKRESKDSSVLAFHTHDSDQGEEINMTEQQIEKKDRKHSNEKEKVPQTCTPPRVQTVIKSRMALDIELEAEDDEINVEAMIPQRLNNKQKKNQKQKDKPQIMNKRKRRRIDEIETDEDETQDESESFRDEFDDNEEHQHQMNVVQNLFDLPAEEGKRQRKFNAKYL
ncbi:MAG: hypothetical protein EZS28_022941 [Streblomastix strix]|uniref:Uncharacterized protein n=1 Tax=Streblomastix strix TaxID=222440 RepID=A0A5J4VG84_9EUKA|nr:MAG: hypothetical protein EZS28_022941 [Streblomastix strix]